MVIVTPVTVSPEEGVARIWSLAIAPEGYIAPGVAHVHVTVGASASTIGRTLIETVAAAALFSKSEAVTVMVFGTSAVPSTSGAESVAVQVVGWSVSCVIATDTPSIDAEACFTPTSASTIVAETAIEEPSTNTVPADGAVMVMAGGLAAWITLSVAVCAVPA